MNYLFFTAKRILFSLLAMGLIFCNIAGQRAIFISENSNSEAVGTKIIKQLLEREEIMMYETDFLNTVHYAEAITAMGAVKLAVFLNDSALVEGLKGRYEGILANFDTLPANHVDANIIGVLPLQFYHWSKNPEYKRMGLEMADKQWENPLPGGLSNQVRYWIDDKGKLSGICVGTGQSKDAQYYLDRPSVSGDLHGQAPMLWLSFSILESFEN